MFRVVPLQAMHRLLGERSEYLVKDRLVDPLRGSTMRFLGLDLCLALRDHMPAEVARCLAERIITKAWANAVDLLGDDDNLPPGFTSWAGHPWFTRPPLIEAEWAEAEHRTAAVKPGPVLPTG